jgi:AmmeMemoRadiSam system protein B
MSCAPSISPEEIRKPVVAGQFYPDVPEMLAGQIDEYLQRAHKETLSGEVLALIAPHAGYMYSGQVAAYAYKQLQGKPFKTVIVIAPSHRAAFAGASIYPRGGYQTPLGVIPVNAPLAKAIMEMSDRLNFYPQAHALEHSLEVQLPFLQRVMGEFQLVPIIMGDQDLSTCQILATAMASVVKEDMVMVASSDLSHYHSYDKAVQLDRAILNAVNEFDPLRLQETLQDGIGEACGGGPMVAAMLAAQKLGATGAKVLNYANSGDVTGDRGHVVGYMAAAVFAGGG